jgi:hypothetical protein
MQLLLTGMLSVCSSGGKNFKWQVSNVIIILLDKGLCTGISTSITVKKTQVKQMVYDRHSLVDTTRVGARLIGLSLLKYTCSRHDLSRFIKM